MRRESVVRVAEKVQRVRGGVRSDPEGIRVRRFDSRRGMQEWRLRSGSGIAGNSGVWWLEPVGASVSAREGMRGPFRTVRELERGLRQWGRWE